jgi:ferredoxin
MIAGKGVNGDTDELMTLAALMQDSSFCGLGQSVAIPMKSVLTHFGAEFAKGTFEAHHDSEITIDGQCIQTESGKTVLQVARENGVNIPTLCYHKDLSPTGNCRMCVVEVKGGRFPSRMCDPSVGRHGDQHWSAKSHERSH